MAESATSQGNQVPVRTMRFDVLLAGAEADVAAARQTILAALGPCSSNTVYAPLPHDLEALGHGVLLGPWESVVLEADPQVKKVRAFSVVTPLKLGGWLAQWSPQHPNVVMAVLGRTQCLNQGLTAKSKVAFITVALPDPTMPMVFHRAFTVSQAKKNPRREGWGQARNSVQAKHWLLETMLSPLISSDVMQAWCQARQLDHAFARAPLQPSRRF